MARWNPLNRLHLWNSRRQPRVISSKQAPIAAPAQPLDTVRTAGCCEQEKRRFRRHPFILLSRRGAQNHQLLPIWLYSTFAAFPFSTEAAALDFGQISCSPARRRNVRFLGFRWVRARLCPQNRTQPRHAAHADGRAVSCCASWNASNRFRMRSCSHSASSFASFCS